MRYIEIIVLTNLLIHTFMVFVSNFIFKQKCSYLMLGISSIIDIIYTTLYLLIPYQLEDYKYVFIILISIIPFLKKGITKALLSSLVYLMMNFTLGGISEQIYLIINNFWAVFIALLSMMILFLFIRIYKKINFKHNELLYSIEIIDNKKILKLKGYCDTGNFLVTDNNIPVVFINKKYKIGNYKKSINVNTVSTKRPIRLYEVESFKIEINGKYIKKDIYLAYGDISFSIMFGLDLLGG